MVSIRPFTRMVLKTYYHFIVFRSCSLGGLVWKTWTLGLRCIRYLADLYQKRERKVTGESGSSVRESAKLSELKRHVYLFE